MSAKLVASTKEYGRSSCWRSQSQASRSSSGRGSSSRAGRDPATGADPWPQLGDCRACRSARSRTRSRQRSRTAEIAVHDLVHAHRVIGPASHHADDVPQRVFLQRRSHTKVLADIAADQRRFRLRASLIALPSVTIQALRNVDGTIHRCQGVPASKLIGGSTPTPA